MIVSQIFYSLTNDNCKKSLKYRDKLGVGNHAWVK